MKLSILGLAFGLMGTLILLLNNIFTGWHNKDYGQPWNKRYYWNAWRPLIKITHPSGKIERKIKWTHKAIVYGFIPPKYRWEILGFLFILFGVILQIL